MNGRWAYYWVQIMAHNLPILWFALMVGLLLMASGLFVKGSPIHLADAIWVLGSLMVMSGVAIKLFDSLKTAGVVVGGDQSDMVWGIGLFGLVGCVLDSDIGLGTGGGGDLGHG